MGKQIRNTITIIVLAALLTACSSGSATGTPTPVPTETPLSLSGIRVSTLSPPATNTPVPATATPLPTNTVAPSATPGCVIGATFIADVTIPDGSDIASGSSFVKTWRIKNSGTCAWGVGLKAVFVEGDQLGGASSVSIPSLDAGRTADVSLTLKAPANPGAYKGKWQVRASSGAVLTALTVSIVVSATPTLAATTTPTATVKPTPVPTFAAAIDSFVGLWLTVEDKFGSNMTDTQRLQQLQINKDGNQLEVSPATTFGSPYQFGIGFQSAAYSGGPRMQWEFDDPKLGHVSITMSINKLCNASASVRYPGFNGRFIVQQPLCQLPEG